MYVFSPAIRLSGDGLAKNIPNMVTTCYMANQLSHLSSFKLTNPKFGEEDSSETKTNQTKSQPLRRDWIFPASQVPSPLLCRGSLCVRCVCISSPPINIFLQLLVLSAVFEISLLLPAAFNTDFPSLVPLKGLCPCSAPGLGSLLSEGGEDSAW